MAVSLFGALFAASTNTSAWTSQYLKGQFFGRLTKKLHNYEKKVVKERSEIYQGTTLKAVFATAPLSSRTLSIYSPWIWMAMCSGFVPVVMPMGLALRNHHLSPVPPITDTLRFSVLPCSCGSIIVSLFLMPAMAMGVTLSMPMGGHCVSGFGRRDSRHSFLGSHGSRGAGHRTMVVSFAFSHDGFTRSPLSLTQMRCHRPSPRGWFFGSSVGGTTSFRIHAVRRVLQFGSLGGRA